ncbi:MAG: iron-containing redox enzyme family protein [Candidatus Woesearchaeota archaeon]|nr:iron-containing redox enzyme family protein [Candidatus Woesearchaeota archaeon]
MALVEQFSAFEDDLIRQFHALGFFRNFNRLSDTDLREYLTQKWFLSMNFVGWYDRAINALNDPEAKEVLKKIVHDETPRGAPSHREDLLADLEAIGISRADVLSARPTRTTQRSLMRLNQLVAFTDDPDYDLRVMSALRIAGEILVAEEYRHVVPELEQRYGLTPERSRFYAPHFYHDRKDSETGQHTHSFESVLERLISDEGKLRIATESAEHAFQVRTYFHNQFDARLRARKALPLAGFAAAAVALMCYVGSQISQKPVSSPPRSPPSRTNLPEAGVQFYLQADRWLLQRYEETRDRQYLKNIGTFEAARDVWGPGP